MKDVRINGIYLIMVFLPAVLVSCGGGSGDESPPPPQGGVDEDTVSVDTTGFVTEGIVSADGPWGRWDTTLGFLTLEIDEDGRVVGEYPLGTLIGTLDGHRLEYEYREGGLTGSGYFEFSEDFSTFEGIQNIAGSEVIWEGTRMD